MDDAREDVAAQLVGAEPVRRRWAFECGDQVLIQRIDGQDRGEQAEGGDRQQIDRPQPRARPVQDREKSLDQRRKPMVRATNRLSMSGVNPPTLRAATISPIG